MLIRFLKTVVGILLIPLAIGTSRAFYEQMLLLGNAAQGTHMLERGIMVYVLFHVVIARPIYLYVVGHECVHVLATWICGGRVERFNISKSGGSVVTSKTNFFIELSPYFVPIYTLLLAPVFLVIRSNIFGHPNFNINDLFIFLVGITLAFHFVMTSEVLRMEQSDIAKSGFVLSMVVILTANLVVTLGVFCPFFNSVSFLGFIKNTWSYSYGIYNTVGIAIASWWNWSVVFFERFF